MNENKIKKNINNKYYRISEKDFYPPDDKRYLTSKVYNAKKDDYNDYLHDYHSLCDYEELFED